MTYISGLSGIPDEPHFAIITTSTILIPGDERSRTNPGHGYSEHSETTINYQMYTNEAEWKVQIDYLTRNQTPFKAMRVTPAKISTTVHVEVS